MKYENAKDILPASLLEEVQKYAEGKVIYIPKSSKPKGWGEASGNRERLNKRNVSICSRYSAGASIFELAEEFFLSPESIKKIVYGKKLNLPEYSPSIYSAERYSDAGYGEEWVRIFLEKADIEIPDMSEYFLSELVKIPLRLIDSTDTEVKDEDAEPDSFPDAPLIIVFEDHKFNVICGEEHLRFLRKEKKNAYYAFIFARNEEYSYYLNNFGKQFQR